MKLDASTTLEQVVNMSPSIQSVELCAGIDKHIVCNIPKHVRCAVASPTIEHELLKSLPHHVTCVGFYGDVHPSIVVNLPVHICWVLLSEGVPIALLQRLPPSIMGVTLPETCMISLLSYIPLHFEVRTPAGDLVRQGGMLQPTYPHYLLKLLIETTQKTYADCLKTENQLLQACEALQQQQLVAETTRTQVAEMLKLLLIHQARAECSFVPRIPQPFLQLMPSAQQQAPEPLLLKGNGSTIWVIEEPNLPKEKRRRIIRKQPSPIHDSSYNDTSDDASVVSLTKN